MSPVVAIALMGVGAAVLVAIVPRWLQLRRAEFIRTYRWPPGLLKRLEKHHPGFERKDSALVSRGLAAIFPRLPDERQAPRLDALASRRRSLARIHPVHARLRCVLPPRLRRLPHHTPAVVLSEHRKSNEGLRRVWWYCCKYENIDPVSPTRLPLLFALDSKLKIANGFVYHPDCEELRKNGSGAAYCGGDFADTSFDGSSDGFGDTGSGG